MIPGLTVRLTKSGIPVMRLHYSADSKKRPGTTAGEEWLAQATQGYPGGTNSPRWRKEMEIDYGALGGTRLIPGWEQWRTNGRIIIPPFEPTGYTLYGSYDHGWRHRAAYHVHGVNSEGDVVTLWECCDSHIPYQYLARVIQGETVRIPPIGCACPGHQSTRTLIGNPYAGRERYKVADPSIWAHDQQQSDNTMKSTATLFKKEGVHFIEGSRGMDTTVAEWLMGYYWRNPLEPRYRITTACPALIWEIGQQRHKDVSAQVALNRSQPEQLVDKDNDAWDSMKYFLSRFPPTPQDRVPDKTPNTFGWWRAQSREERTEDEQAASPSFRVTTPIQSGPIPHYQRAGVE